MDEFNQGWDPEVRQYFRKIMNTFGAGAFWMLSIATLGLFFRLAIIRNGIQWYNLVFYAVFLITFFLLIRYFFKLWRKN